MLASPAKFSIEGATPNDQALSAWQTLGKIKKSQFALKHAIDDTGWVAPRYILDGLRWLAFGSIPDADAAIGQAAAVVDAPKAEIAHHG